MDQDELMHKVLKFISAYEQECCLLPTVYRVCQKNCLTPKEFFEIFPHSALEIS